MTYKLLTDAIESYRDGTLSLEQAAAQEGVSPSELAGELRARGVELRSDDLGLATSTRY